MQNVSNYWLSDYNWQAVLNNETDAQLVREFLLLYDVIILSQEAEAELHCGPNKSSSHLDILFT